MTKKLPDKIIISHVFDAQREKVWQAWTDPVIVKTWWGPKDFTSPSIKIDFKVGGKYIYCMHGPAGSPYDFDMYSSGVYKEITPIEKIIVSDYFSDKNGNINDPTNTGLPQNMPKEMLVTVTFEDVEDNKTKLSIIYNPESAADRQVMIESKMEEGWSSSLDKLAQSLAAG
jgi:uncharacterized protein YndB with AHSA1/START domain